MLLLPMKFGLFKPFRYTPTYRYALKFYLSTWVRNSMGNEKSLNVDQEF